MEKRSSVVADIGQPLDRANFLEDVEARIRAAHGVPYQLHIGRTFFAPLVSVEDLASTRLSPEPQEYASPLGLPELRESICTYQRATFGLDADIDQVLITAGGTHALSVAVRSIVKPGDEVLVLSPHWMFAPGVISSCGGTPVEVPVFLELATEPSFSLLDRLDRAMSARTRAIYFNSPNNPTGCVLSPALLEDLARWTKRRGLWMLADNVYEGFDFSTAGFVNVASMHAASEHSISIHSFSKTFSMPGYRVGYVITPKRCMARARDAGIHTAYAVATLSQHAACMTLDVPSETRIVRCAQIRAARDLVEETLRIPSIRSEGGFYKLLRVSKSSRQSVSSFIDACIRNGVSLTPGAAFGECSADYVRLCYTSIDIARLPEAIAILNETYAEWRRDE